MNQTVLFTFIYLIFFNLVFFYFQYVKERITLLRGSGLAGNKSAIVALQPFLHEIQGSWYESAVIAIQVPLISSQELYLFFVFSSLKIVRLKYHKYRCNAMCAYR